MAKHVTLDIAEIEWVQFRPVNDGGDPVLQGFGYLSNDAGLRVPVTVEGWDGISPETKTAVRRALLLLMVECAGRELEVDPHDLEVVGTRLRVKEV